MGEKIDASSIDIKVKRLDRVFRIGDSVEGTVTVHAKDGWSHKGVNLIAEGLVHLTSSGRGQGDINALGKPLCIFRHDIEIASSGKFADGSTEIPFDFILRGTEVQPLMESYHGVYISVIYSIQVGCDRNFLKKSLYREIEFIVEIASSKIGDPSPLVFNISPENFANIDPKELANIPNFKVSGRLHRTFCLINQPFTGEVIIQEAGASIRSLELQLVRVETIIFDGAATREATEIQNIQIGEGNVCRGIVVPMYMIFPRLFSCPTIISSKFKIEFEVNLIVVFNNGYMITENFPVVILRE